jgi:hypothetical protein
MFATNIQIYLTYQGFGLVIFLAEYLIKLYVKEDDSLKVSR